MYERGRMISYERLCEALDHFNRERRGEAPPPPVAAAEAEAAHSPDEVGAVVGNANDLVIDDAPGVIASTPAPPEEPVVDPAYTEDLAGAEVPVDPAYAQDPAPAVVPVDPAQGLGEQAAGVQVDSAYVQQEQAAGQQEEQALEPRVDGNAIPVNAVPMEGEAAAVTGVPLEDPSDPTL